jgi:hypothetical protein
MGGNYEIVIHLDVKVEALQIMHDMHTRFCHHGLGDQTDKRMILSNYKKHDDYTWEPYEDLYQTFERLAEHPTLGALIYAADVCPLVVDYKRLSKEASVQCISISFEDSRVEDEESRQAISRLLALVVETSVSYKALRTIWQWELEAAYRIYWQEERRRLFKHKIIGFYWLDILREEFVTPERIDLLSRNLWVKSVFKRLDDGSLYFQRSVFPEKWYEKMSFKEFVPASCEVFVIPLVCAYVTFLVCLPSSKWGALIFPGIWFVIVSLFAIGDYFSSDFENEDHWLFIKRMLLILGCLLPVALLFCWAWIADIWNRVEP